MSLIDFIIQSTINTGPWLKVKRFNNLTVVRKGVKLKSYSYLISVLLTMAGSVNTTTGMAKLKKQFLKDWNS